MDILPCPSLLRRWGMPRFFLLTSFLTGAVEQIHSIKTSKKSYFLTHCLYPNITFFQNLMWKKRHFLRSKVKYSTHKLKKKNFYSYRQYVHLG